MLDKSNKIVIFTTAFRPFIGGSEIAIEEIAKRLPEFFFEIITPRFSRKLAREELGDNFRIHRIGLGSKLDKFLFPVVGFLKARRLSQKILIHSYQASYGGGAGWLMKLFYPKTRFIVTLQEGKDLNKQGFFVNFFRKLIIKKADSVTAISHYLKNYVFKISPSLKTEIIPNGVDIDNFSRNFSYGELTDFENELGIKADDRVIISVSRLVPKNGLDLLIKAMAVFKHRSSDSYKLLLVGDGKDRQELERLSEELGVKDRIIFAGSVDNGNLPIYLKVSDVFVRPSRSEGLGNSFLEAMAAGVPVIGPKIGGIPDFLKDRETGLYCSLEPEDIAFKINIIFQNEILRQNIIRNGQDLVKREYNWDLISDKFRKIYV